MSSIIKNVLLAVGLGVLLWLGYVVFIQEDDATLSTSNSFVTSQAERDTRDFILKLEQLQAINIDQSLFSSPEFNSLVDYRQDIVEEPYGRENPFAPVGVQQ